MKKPTRIPLFFIPPIVALFGVLVLVQRANNKPFNSTEWKAVYRGADPLASNVRKSMVNDLTRNHLQKGMRHVEVLALLGEPSVIDGTRKHDADIYWLGDSRSQSLNLEYKNDKLIDIRIE